MLEILTGQQAAPRSDYFGMRHRNVERGGRVKIKMNNFVAAKQAPSVRHM